MNIPLSILLLLLFLFYFKFHYKHSCEVRASSFEPLLSEWCGLLLWTLAAIVFLKLDCDLVHWMGSEMCDCWLISGASVSVWMIFSVLFLVGFCDCNLPLLFHSFFVSVELICFLGIQTLSYAGLWVMLW